MTTASSARALSGYGQGSPWQDLCTLTGTVEAIMIAMDEPDRMHHMLQVILSKRLETLEKSPPNPSDIVETGGGRGVGHGHQPGAAQNVSACRMIG